MSKSATPKWIIDADWAVGTDPYNWILYRRSGKKWKPDGYFASAEQLLQSLYRQLTRLEVTDPDLVRHLEVTCERAQAAASAFSDAIGTRGQGWPSIKALRHAS